VPPDGRKTLANDQHGSQPRRSHFRFVAVPAICPRLPLWVLADLDEQARTRSRSREVPARSWKAVMPHSSFSSQAGRLLVVRRDARKQAEAEASMV